MNIIESLKEHIENRKMINSTTPVSIDDLVGSEIKLVSQREGNNNYVVGSFPELSLLQRFTYQNGNTGEEIEGHEGVLVISIEDRFQFRSYFDGNLTLISEGGWGGYMLSKFGKDPMIAKLFPDSISEPNEDYMTVDRYLKSIGH